jgi:hypothetical protein
MERRNVPESIICAVNGHSPGEGVDKKTYVATAMVLECRDVLASLPSSSCRWSHMCQDGSTVS